MQFICIIFEKRHKINIWKKFGKTLKVGKVYIK